VGVAKPNARRNGAPSLGHLAITAANCRTHPKNERVLKLLHPVLDLRNFQAMR
jgi:hypothetical protein